MITVLALVPFIGLREQLLNTLHLINGFSRHRITHLIIFNVSCVRDSHLLPDTAVPSHAVFLTDPPFSNGTLGYPEFAYGVSA